MDIYKGVVPVDLVTEDYAVLFGAELNPVAKPVSAHVYLDKASI